WIVPPDAADATPHGWLTDLRPSRAGARLVGERHPSRCTIFGRLDDAPLGKRVFVRQRELGVVAESTLGRDGAFCSPALLAGDHELFAWLPGRAPSRLCACSLAPGQHLDLGILRAPASASLEISLRAEQPLPSLTLVLRSPTRRFESKTTPDEH